MEPDGIFLETANVLQLLTEQPYGKEDILQRALERYPEVIAGVTTSGSVGTRLALIRRETAVPSEEGGGRRWSLDHLFVDSEAVPVLVEVKRSSDTRIRREVVGQMLDYAANGLKYWPVGELRSSFEARVTGSGATPDEWLRENFGEDDAEEFWRKVGANLEIGNVRLVFVADRLPQELVRIIEFLNEQMAKAEVLGVELRQYVGPKHERAFVPVVIGRTSRAVTTKTVGHGGQQWDEETFMTEARERRTEPEVTTIERLFAHIDERGGFKRWGSGATPGMSGWYPIEGEARPVFNLNLNAPERKAYVSIYLSDLVKRVPRDRLEHALDVLASVDAFKQPVEEARAASLVKWPTTYLPSFAGQPAHVDAVLAAIDVMIGGSSEEDGVPA